MQLEQIHAYADFSNIKYVRLGIEKEACHIFARCLNVRICIVGKSGFILQDLSAYVRIYLRRFTLCVPTQMCFPVSMI